MPLLLLGLLPLFPWMASGHLEASAAHDFESSQAEVVRELASTVVLIGDIHGYLDRLEKLWARLREKLGDDGLNKATVIFLGDFNDRGPNTKGVLDFLCALLIDRAESKAETVFLCGNHDLGFAETIGASPLKRHRLATHEQLMGRLVEAWSHPGESGTGNTSFKSGATFSSYGADSAENRVEALAAAVPEEHKYFLQHQLVFCADLRVAFSPGRVVAVHAGLELEVPAESQIRVLRSLSNPCPLACDEEISEAEAAVDERVFESLSFLQLTDKSRAVLDMHPDLVGGAFLVSGHHSERIQIGEHRWIVDSTGGRPRSTLDAVILPSGEIVQHEEKRGPASLPF